MPFSVAVLNRPPLEVSSVVGHVGRDDEPLLDEPSVFFDSRSQAEARAAEVNSTWCLAANWSAAVLASGADAEEVYV